MTETILVINAGSSSVKFSLYERQPDLQLLASGEIADIGGAPSFAAEVGGAKTSEVLPATSTHEDVLRHIIGWIEKQKHGAIAVAAHRVVHGGTQFTEPVVVTPAIMEQLRALTPLAPLHQPHNLAAVDILSKLKPGIGEHAAGVRQSVLEHLTFLKPFDTLVIPANEDGIMARHAFLLMQNTVKERKAS
jgi:acetate kinase